MKTNKVGKTMVATCVAAAAMILGGCRTCEPQIPQAEVDARLAAFSEEYIGMKIGEAASKYRLPADGGFPFRPKKVFMGLNVGNGACSGGKIVRLQLACDIDKSLTMAGIEAKMQPVLDALEDRFGLDKEYFARNVVKGMEGRRQYKPMAMRPEINEGYVTPSADLFLISYDLDEAKINRPNYWRYVIELMDFDLVANPERK